MNKIKKFTWVLLKGPTILNTSKSISVQIPSISTYVRHHFFTFNTNDKITSTREQ